MDLLILEYVLKTSFLTVLCDDILVSRVQTYTDKPRRKRYTNCLLASERALNKKDAADTLSVLVVENATCIKENPKPQKS